MINPDISRLYLVQLSGLWGSSSLWHNYCCTQLHTGTHSCRLLHTTTYSYTHCAGEIRTGSGKYIKKKERKWKLQQSVSKILRNQSFMSQYGYIYFKWDHLHSTFYTSVCCSRDQDLPKHSCITLEILLYFMCYTFDAWSPWLWSMKDQKCRCNFLII
jgi:hypothetical protein